MAKAGARSLVLGFLHVASSIPSRYRGGYLLLTDYGRPIEFHYTSELSISPLQQALFGAQFERIVYADLLAKPMTDRQSTAPQILVVNSPVLLELRRQIPAPVVAISVAKDHALTATTHRDYVGDLAVFEKVRTMTPSGFDWMEPFDRIAAALAEVTDPATSMAA